MSKFPRKNSITIEKKAKSVEEAVAEALSELGINKDDAVIEIVQEPSKGFLGLGAKEAVVKVSAKQTGENDTKTETAAASPAPETVVQA